VARTAAQQGDWGSVGTLARRILQRDRQSAEGWFLEGLAAKKGGGDPRKAATAFKKAMRQDRRRYDAAVEAAELLCDSAQFGEANDLLRRYESALSNSPLYLDLAAQLYTRLGLHALAWPLFHKANELQPGVPRLQANLAACSVLVGRIEEARAIYLDLLRRQPDHQRNHYELSRLGTARDTAHVEQMKQLLAANQRPPERNIFLYYAIAKELEDLEAWDEAFDYYQRGGDAAAAAGRRAGYDVGQDTALIERIMDVCSHDWLAGATVEAGQDARTRTPVFIVGLPRTGTTLAERIVASHSQVESADETFFMPTVIKRLGGQPGARDVTGETVEAAAAAAPERIAGAYLAAVDYRLGEAPYFIDKYPFNYLYLGLIARAFPEARIVHLRRDPMDACFAMYKQSFFKFAYTLEDLAAYYVAYDRLSRHWRNHLGDRMVELQYEALVADPEVQIRRLLDALGLPFEQACVDFHLNRSPSATASTVQVREKVHTRSVGRWKEFERQLRPLRERLEAAGIEVE
jgi:tetratricopeptide (TPR) repeat protein